jgi:hypothetical protein
VDILVNNAAVFPTRLSIEMSEAIWDQTVDTDLKGTFILSKLAAIEMIKASRGGRIVYVLLTETIRPTGFLAPLRGSHGQLDRPDPFDGGGVGRARHSGQRGRSRRDHDRRRDRDDAAERDESST